MALRTNASLTFTDYSVDDEGIHLHFVSPDPGPGEPSDYYIVLRDTDLAGVTTQGALRTLVENKLKRKLRSAGIASKLDSFIGQSLVV